MLKRALLLTLLLIKLAANAQPGQNLYGIVRKNYFSTVVDPFDSSIVYQQFDSATLQLGSINPAAGVVTNIGTNAVNEPLNLTGAALDPYRNVYIYMGANVIHTLDLASGSRVSSAVLNDPVEPSFFDNFRFNNADSTVYGLTRTSEYDSVTMINTTEMFFAKIDPPSGLITRISTAPIGQGYALAGSAIDPYQMIYYYSTGSNLVGIDLYTGTIYSAPPITITDGIIFDNFTYSCADTALYGLIRQNYFTWIVDTLFPGDSTAVLDSATIKLGRIDPMTGIVTTISPTSIGYGGYSLNAGSAIDPNSMTFYFSTGYRIIGVSLVTGLVTIDTTYSFASGDFFDLMRNFENCKNAVPVRTNSGTTGIDVLASKDRLLLFPNPVTDRLEVRTPTTQGRIEIRSVEGRLCGSYPVANAQQWLSTTTLNPGLYTLQFVNDQGAVWSERFLKR